MKQKSYSNFFINFANETKLAIILALRDGALSVGEIVAKVGEEQSTISHNLKKMADCHILNVEKRGKERIYSLNKETVGGLLKIAEKHVGQNCADKCDKKCEICGL